MMRNADGGSIGQPGGPCRPLSRQVMHRLMPITPPAPMPAWPMAPAADTLPHIKPPRWAWSSAAYKHEDDNTAVRHCARELLQEPQHTHVCCITNTGSAHHLLMPGLMSLTVPWRRSFWPALFPHLRARSVDHRLLTCCPSGVNIPLFQS